MKSNVNKFLLALAVVAGSAAQASSLSCDYLANRNGSPAPGLGRAQIELGGQTANVNIVTEMGGGLSSGLYLVLDRVSHTTYSDERNDAALTVRNGRATLSYRGYSARCVPN